MLNVRFDAIGAFDSMKSNDAVHLGDLVFFDDVHPAIVGHTVSEIVDLANLVISGQVSTPVDLTGDGHGDVYISDLSEALDKLNNNFDDGDDDDGVLALP